MDARSIQVMQAQNNPNILSPLSGASKPTTMTAPPQPPMGQQMAQQASSQMANSLYGPGVKSIASNVDDMTKQLFAYDQSLEKGSSPFPQVQGYVDNPADIMRGAASLAGIQGSNIGQGLSTVKSVESGYQNAINTVMDSFLRFAELQEKRREQESSERNSMLQWILGKTGGAVEFEGKTYNIPTTATGVIDFNSLLDEYLQTGGGIPESAQPTTPEQSALPTGFGKLLGVGGAGGQQYG